MKVALISPPQSPILFPINGALKNGLGHGDSILKGQAFSGVKVPPQQHTVREVYLFTMLDFLLPSKFVQFPITKFFFI